MIGATFVLSPFRHNLLCMTFYRRVFWAVWIKIIS